MSGREGGSAEALSPANRSAEHGHAAVSTLLNSAIWELRFTDLGLDTRSSAGNRGIEGKSAMGVGELDISRLDLDGVSHLKVSGELDLATVAQLLEALDGHIDGQRVVLDTTGLLFIDSTGLHALVKARNKVGIDRFSLVAGPATERLLDLAGIRALFELA